MAHRRGPITTLVAAVVVAGIGIGGVVVGGVAPTPAGAQTDNAGAPASKTGPADEFLALESDGGTLAKADDGKFTLTLKGVDPEAAVFADNPSELSGAVPVSKVVRQWKKLGLDKEPPVAALSVVDGPGHGTASPYELSDPKLDKGTVSFTATPESDLPANPDVAPAIKENVAAGTGAVPEQFGKSTLFMDPEVNGITQSCTAIVTNKGGTLVVGTIGAVIPIPPVTVIAPDQAVVLKTSNLIGCTMGVVFTTGSRTWHVSLSAVTGRNNTYSASSNVSVIPGDRGSSRWIVQFTLN